MEAAVVVAAKQKIQDVPDPHHALDRNLPTVQTGAIDVSPMGWMAWIEEDHTMQALPVLTTVCWKKNAPVWYPDRRRRRRESQEDAHKKVDVVSMEVVLPPGLR